jgi:hypothetical protein
MLGTKKQKHWLHTRYLNKFVFLYFSLGLLDYDWISVPLVYTQVENQESSHCKQDFTIKGWCLKNAETMVAPDCSRVGFESGKFPASANSRQLLG